MNAAYTVARQLGTSDYIIYMSNKYRGALGRQTPNGGFARACNFTITYDIQYLDGALTWQLY